MHRVQIGVRVPFPFPKRQFFACVASISGSGRKRLSPILPQKREWREGAGWAKVQGREEMLNFFCKTLTAHGAIGALRNAP